MPKHNKYHQKLPTNVSRRIRKKQLIRVRNAIAKDTDGHGVFASHHVFGESMTWIDINFLSKKHPGRYFAGALITLEMDGTDSDLDKAFEIIKTEGFQEPTFACSKDDPLGLNRPNRDAYYKRLREIEAELNSAERKIRPEIFIDTSYYGAAIGFLAKVNTKSLTPESIIEFIEMYRTLGEPIKHGVVWQGEEVAIVPASINVSPIAAVK